MRFASAETAGTSGSIPCFRRSRRAARCVAMIAECRHPTAREEERSIPCPATSR